MFESPIEQAPKISIDYGSMEKIHRVAVAPFGAKWDDVGNFDAFYSCLPKDGNNNVIRGEHIGIDSCNNLIIGDRLIATVRVENLAIVETKDAIQVANWGKAQRVGKIVKALHDQGDARVAFHTKVHRPWGSYTNLKEGRAYSIRRVTVPPKWRLSLQLHHRSEHWVVVTGCAEVTVGDATYFLRNGELAFVPVGTMHRLANPGLLPLELIKIQIGKYTGEDDIVRFADDFDRAGWMHECSPAHHFDRSFSGRSYAKCIVT